MNDQDLIKKIEGLEAQVGELSAQIRKLNNYFKWTAIITVLLIVLPLIGLAFAIPSYLSQLNTLTSF